MENKDVLKLIYIISEIFYKNGKYGLERISLICRMIKQVYDCKNFGTFDISQDVQRLEDFEIKALLEDVYEDLFKIFNRVQIRDLLESIIVLIRKFSSKDIAQAIQQLVDNDSKSSNLIPTDDFSIKIMQAFAKEMNSGYYIDPCVGSGRLLSGLDAKSLIGYDINAYCKDIAETYLDLAEWEEYKDRFSLYISTENFLYLDLRLDNSFVGRTFIFDPPLNDQLELYGEMYKNLSANNIYSANNNIPSEYAFLSKILFSIPDKENTGFICVFANNFLSAQDKFKMTFRRYLMDKSLIAVIQSNFSENNKIQKLILVGKNRLDNPHNSLRYFITPKDKNISEDDISRIVQKCLNNETFDEKEFYNIAKIKAYTLQEIRENDYLISMPQYFEDEINPNEIKSLTEIVDDLKTSNQNLIDASIDLEKLLNDLRKGEKNNKKPTIPQQNKYTTKGKKWYEIEKSEEAAVLKEIIDKAQVLKEDNNLIEVCFDVEKNSIKQILAGIKILNKYNRIYTKPDRLYINISKKCNKNKERLYNIIKRYYEKKTEFLSEKQFNIYKTLVYYYLNYKFNNNKHTLSLEQYFESDIYSTLYTLKTLGILQQIPVSNKNINIKDLDLLSEMYLPFKGIMYWHDFEEGEK